MNSAGNVSSKRREHRAKDSGRTPNDPLNTTELVQMHMTDQAFAQWLSNASPKDLQKYLMMGRCRLLETAVTRKLTDVDFSTFDATREQLRPKLQVWRKDDAGVSVKVFDGFDLLDSRVKLIRGFRSDFAPDDEDPLSLKAITEGMVTNVAKAWRHARLPKVKEQDEHLMNYSATAVAGGLEPSFMWVLKTEGALDERLRELAVKHGWSHPGVLLAGELLAALTGDKREVELRVHTKLLLAANHSLNPKGIVARLTVERLPHGCGMLIPDSYHCGYLWMSGGSFDNGLQNAWLAAREYLRQGSVQNESLPYDWRWKLDLLGAVEQLKHSECCLPISGRSGEVAIACALVAAAEGNPDNAGGINPLDPNIAVTATMDAEKVDCDGHPRWQLSNNPELPIRPVSSIKTKTLLDGLTIQAGTLSLERLHRIVCADGQPDGTLPDNDGRFTFPKADRLASAYKELVRFPRMTRGVNRMIAQAARQAQQKLCTPYILPEVADVRLWQHAVSQDPDKHGMRPPDHAILSDEELARLTRGLLSPKPLLHTDEAEYSAPQARLQGNRIFIEADSGLGKSMFLLNCQIQIASDEHLGLLPIRFGRTLHGERALSQIDWRDLDVAKLLASGELARFLDAYNQQLERDHHTMITEDDWQVWMKWMRDQHRIVLLLDALDQTRQEGVESMGGKLGETGWRNCAVILTGRPEAKFSRESATRANDWHELRLVPFNARRWNRYLGITYNADRYIDEAILGVPLLLSMLKLVLPRSGDGWLDLEAYTRNELYDRAVKELISTGLRKVGNEHPGVSELLPNETVVREQLGKVAWRMYELQGFENNLHGTNFDKLEGDLGQNFVSALDLIDVTTSQQLIESGGRRAGLSFRHRSFLEYFLAWHLAGDGDDVKLVELLREIHRVPEEHADRTTVQAESSDAWQDTLRFLLGIVSDQTRAVISRSLIEAGNPWIVFWSLFGDKLALPVDLEAVVCWLVDRASNPKFDFLDALERGNQQIIGKNAADAFRRSGIDVSKMLDRSTRDASLLSPLRELIGDDVIHQHVSQESSLLDQMRSLRGGPPESPKWNFLGSFVSIRGGRLDISRYREHEKVCLKVYDIPGFELADFPVTNELFELFCPTHRRWRDDYSRQDDQPAVYVSWYMADEFCQWLSALEGRTYRLPTEWEWEWACRWLGDERKSPHAHDDYWWGPEMDNSLCWYGRLAGDGPVKSARRTRGRREAIAAFREARWQHPSWLSSSSTGLLDLLGNVWEWCANWYDEREFLRSLRGGSWYFYAFSCRSAYRFYEEPRERRNDVGFRLCRE